MPSPDESVTRRLQRLLTRNISDSDRQRAKLHLIDWLGCALLAVDSPQACALRKVFPSQADATISVLGGGRSGLMEAVHINAALGSVYEMDDIHRQAILHPGPVVIPAAMAVAQQLAASGKSLLDAIVRGYEAMIRLGRAVGPEHYRYWHNTATCGPFGSVAAAASLMKLNSDEAVWAFGNAATQASGLWQIRHEDVMSKQLHGARAAYNGVLAAQLAQSGFTGPERVLEGEQGFFAAMCATANAEDVLLNQSEWCIHEVSFKPWPACRHAHAAIDATLALRQTLGKDVMLKRVRTVIVRTYADALKFCDCVHPKTSLQAKFSLQHAVAVVLRYGEPQLQHFEPEVFNQPELKALRERIELQDDRLLSRAYPRHYGAGVELVDDHGHHEHLIADAWGDPENPISNKQLIAKCGSLMQAAGLSAERAQRFVNVTLDIDQGFELRKLEKLLAKGI